VAGGTAEALWRLPPDLTLTLGLSANGAGGSVENRLTGERPDLQALWDFSFFNQLQLRPLDRVTLVLGTRELYSAAGGFVFLYKAGARIDAGEGLHLSSRVVRNYRLPTLRELYLPYPVANPELRPERALNVDVGAGYSSAHFEALVTGYRTAAHDLIRTFGSWPAAETVNIDETVIWGVEAQLGLKKLGPVALSLSAAWQDVGRYTRQNPEAKADLRLDAGEQLGNLFVAGTLSGEWVHGLYMANYRRERIPDVFVMDATVRCRYRGGAVTLEPYLQLRNFLDRRFAYVEGYPMPGFNVLAGLKVGT